ncbi:GHKL domain-containing protein [Rhodopseudomonas boonkerdii]|uniref:sensor histidine kinase n=1 Tax=Rhodopseudomonas boonkerdii TaxID=475937 RepID=UPI001E283AE4|nr:ATP-binding protein [Rhodopseudomonas boonkerdii]UGV26912.1 GHKL domain-containing protein [Rhodopseudomonas boonkerdii]
MTADVARKRRFWQIVLLSAGLLVLVAISAASVILVNQARKDSGWVVHTVEVENQLATLLLEIRRAESAARAYLLNGQEQFLREHEAAVAVILPGVDKLAAATSDNPVQVENMKRLRPAVMERLAEFARAVNYVKQNDTPSAVAMLPQTGAGPAVQAIAEAGRAIRLEEEKLFGERTQTADRTQQLASLVTVIGSGLVVLLAAVSIFLVRRSSDARDDAEAKLRDNNLNLESAVQERTADLREANEEIQRFAYIVSHDLRSPLVNIMGFTSELEELRGDIFRRIATLANNDPVVPDTDGNLPEPALPPEDKQLSSDFSEALGFIKSSIGKMDRLINAILNLTREGRREFKPVRIDTRELIETIVSTVAHQAAETETAIHVEPLPEIVSDRLALEQIFGNLIDNALKYLRDGVPGEIRVKGRTKMGFVIFEVMDNGRGIDPKDHQRIFDLFRRAGTQDRPGQGIGLAHVRALVRRLGGTMSVSSELGHGSTFTVTLPARWTGKSRNETA